MLGKGFVFQHSFKPKEYHMKAFLCNLLNTWCA